ncbi:protein downstream neighbor of son homolog [Planococcus citri]|uniref:protein downstream neighbor of son homolog n=1 Tax=Planococcus citri TaxID=170843 RepID=UPI0031F93A28
MDSKTTPDYWKRPEDVMKQFKQRMRKRSLKFQTTDQESKSNQAPETTENDKKFASRNPFKRAKTEPGPKFRADLNDDTTTDGTLFRLLNFSQQNSSNSVDDSANNSFANAFAALNNQSSSQKDAEVSDPLKSEDVFVDWTLRWRVRLMSPQSFPWNRKLKTCEEASGITGFVRCLDTDVHNDEINLDTSPNARFHQCCLVWQHPHVPWIDLYPRTNRKSTSSSDLSLLPVKDTLYNAWVDSFRSLFQLVRAKQCPYFYLMANTFVCLFRAAGINGYTEINACITPTSRGFRQLLKDEDIDFTMPLKSSEKTKSPLNGDSQDTGYESLDMAEEAYDKNTNDDDDTDEWLQTMGIEESQIKKMNDKQFDIILGKDKVTDSLPESLVFVEGVEAQALFNFLMNCKSIIPTSGPLAGVPPTLLSPVAFTGASLVSLKIKESMIRMQEKNYHSIEIRGPMLPHMVHNLCDLMKNSSLETFLLAFADIESSKPFTTVTACHMAGASDSIPSPVKTPRTPSVFGETNLSDCGLKPKVLARFCNSRVKQFDSIQFSNNLYTCK